MKRLSILCVFSLLLLSGCDFLRTLAGRPTGAQVEQLRQEKEAALAAREKAVQDSLECACKAAAEARDAQLLDSLVNARGPVRLLSKIAAPGSSPLEYKYYIVVGAFRSGANAERKLAACKAAGYEGCVVQYANGLLAVAICPSGSLEETLKTLKELRGTSICPAEAWILVNA